MKILLCFLLHSLLNLLNAANNTIKVYNDGTGLYTINMKIGTPNQSFNKFYYDTGSLESFVGATDCTSCKGINKFDSSKSSTLQRIGILAQVSYRGDGSLSVAGDF